MTTSVTYYVVKRGNGFWQPTKRMRAQGFASVACGPDGPEARNLALEWNERWHAARSNGDTTPMGASGYIYFLRSSNRIKIGFSKNPFNRAAELKSGMAARISALLAVPGTKADERFIHRRLKSYQTSGEWFADSASVRREMMRALAFQSVRARPRAPTTSGAPRSRSPPTKTPS